MTLNDVRICTILGNLETRDSKTPQISILLDTGAGFDCLSAEFYNKYLSTQSLTVSHNKYAFDASNREITVHGDCYADLLLQGPDGDLKIRAMKFAVLEGLAQDAIIGCQSLGALGLQVESSRVKLNKMTFDRLESPRRQILTIEYGIEIRIEESVIIIPPEGETVTVCAVKPVNRQGAKIKPGLYPIAPDDALSTQLGVSHKLISDHIHSPILYIQDGELEPDWILSFHGTVEKLPVRLKCAFHTGNSTAGPSPRIHNINIKSTFKNEHVQSMIEGTTLPRNTIEKLIRDYKRVFACEESDLGRYKHKVSLKLRDPTADPAYAKPRVVPYKLRPWLDSKLQEMMDVGLICLAQNSPFSSPVQLVRKKEQGKWRLTIDYRLLNQMLVQNRWPIPRICEVLEELSGSRFYSVCDARSGFWQLPLDKASQNMTAFPARGRLYAWQVLPMGLSVSPGIFQQVMMSVLGDDIYQSCVVYIDDIIIYSKTQNDHIAALERIFKKLLEAGIKLHPEKSSFGNSRVDFLGYTVSEEGFIPIQSKVQSILNMERPETKTGLKTFIGSVGFYTTSLPMLQAIMGPLHAISGTKSKFEWKAEQQTAFDEVKQILSSCGPLAFPSKLGDYPLFLTSDASDTGYGSVLSERQPDGSERPLGYLSGTFRNSQVNWPIMEKELYSFYAGLNYFYPQLMATTFTWRTDNKALSTLTTNISLKCKANGTPNAKIIRWLEFCSQYDFSIELVKGTSKEMGLSDCLSRFKSKPGITEQVPNVLSLVTKELVKLPYWTQTGCTLVDFLSAQLRDEELVKREGVWKRWTKGKRAANFRINEDGVREIRIHRKGRYRAMVPKSLIRPIFEFYHSKNHDSARKMVPEINKTLFIPKIYKHARVFMNSCLKCLAVYSRPSTQRHSIKTTTSNHPWATIQIDLLGPLPQTLQGNQYVLAAVCDFTGWLELRALQNKTAEAVVEAINDIITTRGPPLTIQSDNGLEFANRLLTTYLKDLGIHRQEITPYKPSTNGRIEQANKKIAQKLKLLEVDPLTWDASLGNVQLALNWTRQTSGSSAWQLLHGWTLYRPAYLKHEFDEDEHRKYTETETDWAKNQVLKMARLIADNFVSREKKKWAKLEKRAPQPEELKIGTKVLVHFPFLRNSKFFSKWKHVYRIVEVVDLNCFIVQEEGQPRKRYLVDRRRLRIIGPKIAKEDLETIEDLNEEENIDQGEEKSRSLEVIAEETNETEKVHEEESSQEELDKSDGMLEIHDHIKPTEPMTIMDEISSDDEKVERSCEIEFEVPVENSIRREDERPRRRAAEGAKSKIRGWTKELLNN